MKEGFFNKLIAEMKLSKVLGSNKNMDFLQNCNNFRELIQAYRKFIGKDIETTIAGKFEIPDYYGSMYRYYIGKITDLNESQQIEEFKIYFNNLVEDTHFCGIIYMKNRTSIQNHIDKYTSEIIYSLDRMLEILDNFF
jgi:hypothetical protein